MHTDIINLSARQYMDAYSKLPNPEHMRDMPIPGMIYKVALLLEDQITGYNTIVQGKNEYELMRFTKTIEVEFQLVFCNKIVPYWQPKKRILIVPDKVDLAENDRAAKINF